MSEKSAQKRKYILEKAREVFAEKGFKNVTMKDIVEACDISRGGLYLYFSSTEEIFLAVLSEEVEEDDDEAITKALNNDATAGDMLALFLKEQKKEIEEAIRRQEELQASGQKPDTKPPKAKLATDYVIDNVIHTTVEVSRKERKEE